MKGLNILNKFLIFTAILLAVLFIVKIFTYKSWDRYYYISSVSNPEDFPIHLFDIWFSTKDGDYAGDFYKDKDKINAFYSDWGISEYYEAYRPEFLPDKLFLKYMDFRTKDFYLDTIALPKEKILHIFKEAKNRGYLENLSSGGRKMGLEFQVGIANDGHIVLWLSGDKVEKEVFSIQLKPKPFNAKTQSATEQNSSPSDKEYIQNLFRDIPDSVKNVIMKRDLKKVNYRDTVPVYFDNLTK